MDIQGPLSPKTGITSPSLRPGLRVSMLVVERSGDGVFQVRIGHATHQIRSRHSLLIGEHYQAVVQRGGKFPQLRLVGLDGAAQDSSLRTPVQRHIIAARVAEGLVPESQATATLASRLAELPSEVRASYARVLAQLEARGIAPRMEYADAILGRQYGGNEGGSDGGNSHGGSGGSDEHPDSGGGFSADSHNGSGTDSREHGAQQEPESAPEKETASAPVPEHAQGSHLSTLVARRSQDFESVVQLYNHLRSNSSLESPHWISVPVGAHGREASVQGMLRLRLAHDRIDRLVLDLQAGDNSYVVEIPVGNAPGDSHHPNCVQYGYDGPADARLAADLADVSEAMGLTGAVRRNLGDTFTSFGGDVADNQYRSLDQHA